MLECILFVACGQHLKVLELNLIEVVLGESLFGIVQNLAPEGLIANTAAHDLIDQDAAFFDRAGHLLRRVLVRTAGLLTAPPRLLALPSLQIRLVQNETAPGPRRLNVL